MSGIKKSPRMDIVEKNEFSIDDCKKEVYMMIEEGRHECFNELGDMNELVDDILIYFKSCDYYGLKTYKE